MEIQQIIENELSKLKTHTTSNPFDVKGMANQIANSLSEFTFIRVTETAVANVSGIINATLEKNDSYCTDDEDDRKALAGELVGALSEYEIKPINKSPWECDLTQFGRLLAEIRAYGLSKEQYKFLNESMDCSKEEIDELLERAETSWQITKYGEPVTE